MNLARSFCSLSEHCIFVADDGNYYGWGNNVKGSLGIENNKTQNPLTCLPLPQNIMQLASGKHHTLALLKDHSLYAWGAGERGQLGLGSIENIFVPSPTLVPRFTEEKIVGISAGAKYSMAWTESGHVYGWGENDEGQLGTSTKTSELSPVALPPFHSPVVHVACAWDHTFALTKDGALYAWGSNENGILGLGDQINSLIPIQSPLKNISQVFPGSTFTLFLTSTGSLLGCGSNDHGALGMEDPEDQFSPIEIFKSGVVAAAAGGCHCLALLKDGSLYAWGWNLFGQIGIGSTVDIIYSPALVALSNSGGAKPVGVGVGWTTSWAFTKRGDLYVWGAEGGLNSKRNYREPRKVPMKVKVPLFLAWQEAFYWLFLGRADKNSIFFILPVEVVFHAVQQALQM
jgi:alpha-tubulin suppressor-like RCC1 family protein